MSENDEPSYAKIVLDENGAALVVHTDEDGKLMFEIIDGGSDELSSVALKVMIGLGYIASTDPKLVTEAYYEAISEDMVDEAEPGWAADIKGNA